MDFFDELDLFDEFDEIDEEWIDLFNMSFSDLKEFYDYDEQTVHNLRKLAVEIWVDSGYTNEEIFDKTNGYVRDGEYVPYSL